MKKQTKKIEPPQFIKDIYNILFKDKKLKLIFENDGTLKIQKKTKSYDDAVYIDRFTHTNIDYDISNLPSTCSMFELSLDNSYNPITNEFDNNGIKLPYTSFNKIQSLLLKEYLKQNFLHNKYKSSDTVITNVITGSDNQKIITATGLFKKVYEYEGKEGTVYTYMLKK